MTKKSQSFCISANEIYTPYEKLKNYCIVVNNDIIEDMTPKEKIKRIDHEILDFSDSIVVPGLIDVHIHGIASGYTMEAKTESIEKMVKALASHGVTSFSPTLETAPLDALKKASKTIVSLKERDVQGAKITGINLEGPFLNAQKAGAMKVEYIRSPSIDEFDELYHTSQRKVNLITVAPEMPKAIDLIKYVSSLGITASMGHTNATYEETVAAIKAGATHVTHLFNAMRSLHHREPGIIGAVLEKPEISVELITDLVHLHPATIGIIHKIKPLEKVVTVTDSVFADTPKGVHELWEWEIIVKDDVAELLDGTLAGSILTLDKALRNLVFKVGIPMENALVTMTINPARVIKMEKEIGSIEKGKRADFVVMDQKLNVLKTFIDGKMTYDRKS